MASLYNDSKESLQEQQKLAQLYMTCLAVLECHYSVEDKIKFLTCELDKMSLSDLPEIPKSSFEPFQKAVDTYWNKTRIKLNNVGRSW